MITISMNREISHVVILGHTVSISLSFGHSYIVNTHYQLHNA